MGSGTNQIAQDLLKWPEELLAKNIELVVSEIKRIIASVDDNKIEYIVFALENVIQHIPICSVEEMLLYQLCCAVEEIYSSTLAGLDSNLEGSIKLSQFDSKEASLFLLIICNRVIHSLRITCENLCKFSKIKCHQISKFINCSKLILGESFDYFNRNCEIVPELNDEFYSELWQFNLHFWKLITQVIDFDSGQTEDVTLLTNLLCILENDAKNSFSKPKLQLAECWKNLVNLMDKNHNIIGIENQIKCNDIIIHLCCYLVKELGVVETFHQECVINTQSLKIYNFLLKIVVKLCKTFKTNLKECHTELVYLLLVLYKMSPTFLRANNFSQTAVSEINRQVIMASDPLLSLLYNNSQFPYAVKAVFEKNCSENPYGCTMFLISLLKKVNTAGMKELYFSSNFDVMEHFFVSYGFCHNGILEEKFYAPGSAVTQIELKKDLYDYVFCALAVFTLSLSSDEFSLAENVFLKNILQDNPWKAILASDLWCLVARYANVQLCHGTLDTLIAILSKMDLNTARPEFTQLTCFVRRLLQFCEPQYLDSIFENYPLQDNILLWKNLGFQPNKLYSPLIQKLANRLKSWVDNNNNNLEDYQYLEACLDSLSMCSESNDFDSEINLIPRLWSVDVKADTSSVWISYICSLTSFTIVNIAKMEPHQISLVIQQISRLLKKSHKIIENFCILRVMKSLFNLQQQCYLFQQSDIRLIVSVFQSLLLSESTIISTMAMLVFYEFAQNPSFSQIVELIGCEDVNLQNKIANFFQNDLPSEGQNENFLKQVQVNYVHNCSVYKKMASNMGQNGINYEPTNLVQTDDHLDETLDRLEKDIVYIADKENFLNSTHLNRIKSILLTLNEIKL